jgi:hypothetical protein
MITPAQYWISAGSLGGGLGRSASEELGRNVNRSTNEKTLVCRVGAGVGAGDVDDEDPDADAVDAVMNPKDTFSFSFPRLAPDVKARKKLCDSLPNIVEPANGPLEVP